MKNLKTLSALVISAALSGHAFAEPFVIDTELKLVGFSGGNCSISVAANANSSNLDLDTPTPDISVGTLNTQCDYGHRVVASYDGSGPFGDELVLTHTDGISEVPINVRVDGMSIMSPTGEMDLPVFGPGMAYSMPINVDTNIAPIPGVYQGSVTFSVIID